MMWEAHEENKELKDQLIQSNKHIAQLQITNRVLNNSLRQYSFILDWLRTNGHADLLIAAEVSTRMEQGDETSK